MAPRRNRPVEPALLQRLISETLWEIRKATTERDVLTARRAEHHMAALLDQLAGCMIADDDAPQTVENDCRPAS